jgi:hypothetical protein
MLVPKQTPRDQVSVKVEVLPRSPESDATEADVEPCRIGRDSPGEAERRAARRRWSSEMILSILLAPEAAIEV